MTSHHDFERAADEIELSLLDYASDARITLLTEVLSRTLAQAELMPDTKFLSVIQTRIMAIVSEESVPHE